MSDDVAFMLLGYANLMCGIWNFDNYKGLIFLVIAMFIFIVNILFDLTKLFLLLSRVRKKK